MSTRTQEGEDEEGAGVLWVEGFWGMGLSTQTKLLASAALLIGTAACGLLAPVAVPNIFRAIIACENSFGPPPPSNKGAVSPLLAVDPQWSDRLDETFKIENGRYKHHIIGRGNYYINYLLFTPFFKAFVPGYLLNPYFQKPTPPIHPYLGASLIEWYGLRTRSIITADHEPGALAILGGEPVKFAALIAGDARLTLYDEQTGNSRVAFEERNLPPGQLILACDAPDVFYDIGGGSPEDPKKIIATMEVIAGAHIPGKGTPLASELHVIKKSVWDASDFLRNACGQTIEARNLAGAIIWPGVIPESSIAPAPHQYMPVELLKVGAYRVREDESVTCE